MDEKLKHRLIGLAVIVSLFILIIPFFIKKNQPDLTELTRIQVTPPAPTPRQPSVKVEPVTIDFTTVQVAQVDLDQTQTRPTPTTIALSTEDGFMPNEADPDYLPGEIMPMEPEEIEPTPIPPEPIRPIKPIKPLEPVEPVKPMKPMEPQLEPVTQTQTNLSENPTGKTIAQGEWVVQLGSFANRANADALFRKLQNKGFPVMAKTSTNAQGTLITRILVGPHLHRQQAERVLQDLEQAVKLKGIVIQWNG